MKRFLILACFLSLTVQAKIVGLVPVRNEQHMIVPCLKVLSMFVDAIVVLDDASEDSTLQVVKSLQQECNIERIIEKKKWYRDEPGDRNLLLQAGREIGGTHFVAIDADEMLTSNLLTNNVFRNKVLALKPGDKLCVTWINLWRSCSKYRYDFSVWCEAAADIAFCDDGECFYQSGFIHTSRSPSNLNGNLHKLALDTDLTFLNDFVAQNGDTVLTHSNSSKKLNKVHLQRYLRHSIIMLENDVNQSIEKRGAYFFPDDGTARVPCYRNDYTAGLMHFQFVNWHNLLAKQAWYRCLEKIRNPVVDANEINNKYGMSKNEEDIGLLGVPKEWFERYHFFNKDIYEKSTSWQYLQIQSWIKQYGHDYFKDLDIWDVIR